MGVHGLVVLVVGHDMGLGALPQGVLPLPLLPPPPDDRLRLPSEDERLEVSSSGEDKGDVLTATVNCS